MITSDPNAKKQKPKKPAVVKDQITIKAQLHVANNSDLHAYFDEVAPTYGYITRRVFHELKNGILDDLSLGDTEYTRLSSYQTRMQQQFGICYRTANSIQKHSQGMLDSARELQAYNITSLEAKIAVLQEKRQEIIESVEKKKPLARQRKLNDAQLQSYRNNKRAIAMIAKRINRLKQRVQSLSKQIESQSVNVCFGSKKLARKGDKDAFIAHRDKQLFFVGKASDNGRNGLVQLSYNKRNNQFDIRIRKDFNYKDAEGDDRYVWGRCYFNHHKDKLIAALNDRKGSPLTYRIIKENGRYYILCTFTITNEKQKLISNCTKGVVGVDFNKGFLAISAVNSNGHLVANKQQDYRFKQGNKTQHDLRLLANEVVKQAKSLGMGVAIEDLDFTKSKQNSKSTTGLDKQKNEMLHSLAYTKFACAIQTACARHEVRLIRVNPAYTSYIGKMKYAEKMKLNSHQAAAMVIARRSMKFKDKVSKDEKAAYEQHQEAKKVMSKIMKEQAKLAKASNQSVITYDMIEAIM